MTNKKYQIQTYVSEDVKQKLDKICAKYCESLSSVTRRALIKFLELEEKNNA